MSNVIKKIFWGRFLVGIYIFENWSLKDFRPLGIYHNFKNKVEIFKFYYTFFKT